MPFFIYPWWFPLFLNLLPDRNIASAFFWKHGLSFCISVLFIYLCLYGVLLVHVYSVVFDSFPTPWTVACQVPLSMEFSRQEYWSGLPFLPAGNLPDPGIPSSLVSPALVGRFFTIVPPSKPIEFLTGIVFRSCSLVHSDSLYLLIARLSNLN